MLKMPDSMPSTATVPKCAMEYNMMSSAPERMLGSTSGMVILRVMVKRSAPEMRAASSRVGSMRSRAPHTWMNTKGNRYMVSTAMMPW